ncbi:hypothetical protein CHL78_003850 [Romboutsia weinsteinii]|uniref:VanZ-like domain-containing protein n=1 Tax=Romboutsia weinsteinii TaxID=2020949 RepID=A0A371J7C5_9FIRM|nr:hypothetical protein CHL78_003850 [Romboutsia weinsteinii]
MLGGDGLNKKTIILIAIVLLWMGVIYNYSDKNGKESKLSSDRVIKAVEVVGKTSLADKKNSKMTDIRYIRLVRKSAHIMSYLILAVLVFMASYEIKKSINKSIWYSFIISTLYAMSDEYHQYFVPGRSASIKDVGIDMIGIILGIILIYTIYKKVKKVNL